MIDFYFKKIKKDLSSYQFDTFLIGIRSSEDKKEEEKKMIKRILGGLIERELKKRVDFKDPDIVIIIELKNKKIEYQIKPLYIYGRYLKIKKSIPQTRWHKKIYKTSVQEEIGDVVLNYSKGKDHSFHGCGREDVDVLMVGDGRPFVLEIRKPQKRNFDLKKAQKEINKNSKWVRVRDLTFTQKEKIKELKESNPSKIYQVEIQLKRKVGKEKLKKIEKKFTNILIRQRTPKRVSRRRRDLTRIRKIFYFKLIKYHPLNPIFEIKSEGGTYIKELISGDEKRTEPSLSALLEQQCFVKKLKVIKIEYQEKKKWVLNNFN